MSLELVNTFGTLLTVAIIAATAIAAMVQLRHLRAGNQISAMLTIGDRYYDREFTQQLNLVRGKLAVAMEDPTFRTYVVAILRLTTPPETAPEYVELRRAAVSIGNTHEELATLVKNGVIDKRLYLELYGNNIIVEWKLLEDYTAFNRAVSEDPAFWENFELLTVLSREWLKLHPSSYPREIGRISLYNRWPVPPLPETA